MARINNHLSPREKQLLRLCLTIDSYKQIAIKMSIKGSTVRNMMSTIFTKLGCRSRILAVMQGIQTREIDPPYWLSLREEVEQGREYQIMD